MNNTKYVHLIKTDFIKKGMIKPSGAGKGEYLVWLMGKDLEGLNINFAWGVCNQASNWLSKEKGLHVHPFDECLLFSGLDYSSPASLRADIEMGIGENNEKYVFDSPTTVVIPKGLPHTPPVTRKVAKTYGFGIISLDGEHKTTKLPRASHKPETAGLKYQHLVKKMTMRDAKRKSGGNADFISGSSGKDLEGFNLNFTWAFHTGLGAWHPGRDPHVHPYGEILVFVGLDVDNPSYLGAEIEISMGTELEKYIFDTPTIVVVPGGLVHCPLVTRRVEKPYGFSAICLNGEHLTTWLGPDKDKPFQP